MKGMTEEGPRDMDMDGTEETEAGEENEKKDKNVEVEKEDTTKGQREQVCRNREGVRERGGMRGSTHASRWCRAVSPPLWKRK